MRITVGLLAVWLLGAGSNFVVRGADVPARPPVATEPSARQFAVECRVISKELSFTAPKVTLFDGEKVAVTDTTRSHFVIATKSERGAEQPVTRVVTEGTTIDVTVVGFGDDRAILDLTVEMAGAMDAPAEHGQSVRVTFEKGRVLECVSLGKKITAPMHGWTIEAVVHDAAKTKPGETAFADLPEVKPEAPAAAPAKNAPRLFARFGRQRNAD